MWKNLCHPNVLPLLGVGVSQRRPAMISERMRNGNINEFLMVNRSVNRFELVGASSYCPLHPPLMTH